MSGQPRSEQYAERQQHGQRDCHMLINSDGKVAGAFTREDH